MYAACLDMGDKSEIRLELSPRSNQSENARLDIFKTDVLLFYFFVLKSSVFTVGEKEWPVTDLRIMPADLNYIELLIRLKCLY